MDSRKGPRKQDTIKLLFQWVFFIELMVESTVRHEKGI